MKMNWNKRAKSAVAVYGIAAFVFILIFLATPFSKPAASWMMFAFSILSFAAGLGISLYAFGKAETLVSKFYGYPVFRIGFLYTAAQLLLSILVFIIGAFVDVPYWIGLILSVLLLGMAAIGVIAADNARDYIEEVDVKTAAATKTITKFNIDIADLLDLCKDEAVKAPLQKLVTKFKYSDPVSSDATKEKEEEIQAEIKKLRSSINSESAEKVIAEIETISNLLSSRNRICEAEK